MISFCDSSRRATLALLAVFSLSTAAIAQELEERVSALEKEVERLQLGDVIGPLGTGAWGLGPAASKVYGVAEGLSIGGYGEFLYRQNSGSQDVFDALRSVFYIGYKFDSKWVVNTEIEIEHGTTSSSSGSTSSSGSVSLEFGSIDYLHAPELNFRAGLLLVPVGLINELHEPNTFFGAGRPETEQRIIPTTWRSTGVGVFGESCGFSYRAYALSSLDGEEFSSSGLRSGRQKGNRSASDDFAFVGRADYIGTPGLMVGGSVYVGDTGQDGIDTSMNVIPPLRTTILEGHVQWEPAPGWRTRALYATALIDDTSTFNTNTGENLAKRMEGFYGEVAFDWMSVVDPESEQSVSTFFRYEQVDTQADMAPGFAADPSRDETVLTFGFDYKPIPQVVVKVDFQDFDVADDRFNVLFGYAF